MVFLKLVMNQEEVRWRACLVAWPGAVWYRTATHLSVQDCAESQCIAQRIRRRCSAES